MYRRSYTTEARGNSEAIVLSGAGTDSQKSANSDSLELVNVINEFLQNFQQLCCQELAQILESQHTVTL